MSSAKIVAQGNPQQVIGLSTTELRLPVLLHVRAQVGAAGALTLVFGRDTTTGHAGTTVDTTVAQSGNGIYDFQFNPCRGFVLGSFVFAYLPAVTGADKFEAVVDRSTTNTNGTTGKLRIVTNTIGAAGNANPTQNSEFHFSLWADLG